MQTIENSLLQLSVDENGAKIINLASQNDKFDYLKNSEKQENVAVAFPAIDQEKNWAQILPWTVVDKGDSRVSLTLIDTKESYHDFPYHFEVVLTYALEGNQVIISFYLKNNSHKKMPFSLGLIIPILTGWQVDQGINQVTLGGVNDHELKVDASEFTLSASEDTIFATTDELTLESDSSQNFKLMLTLS